MALTGMPIQLGFLTVIQEAGGFLGGYLVTNLWGRPLEFRLSTAVQPNRVQQILYAHTLPGYLHGELIGKTLVEKTSIPASLIFTDRASALDLRAHIDVPVLWLAGADASPEQVGMVARPAEGSRPALVAHARFPDDLGRIEAIFEQIDRHQDLMEPFARIREAVAEARKMGVTGRAS